MGDKQNQPFQLSFNASLKFDFQGSRGGLILVRELDEHLGLGELIAQHLTDSRHGTALTSRLQSFETELLAGPFQVRCSRSG